MDDATMVTCSLWPMIIHLMTMNFVENRGDGKK
jgi:hypothetical protein